jgi:hypothetical protein
MDISKNQYRSTGGRAFELTSLDAKLEKILGINQNQ